MAAPTRTPTATARRTAGTGAGTAGAGTGSTVPPTLRVEKRLLREGHTLVGACDEVGRGALGGPVTVGIVLVDASVQRPLAGVRDSKLLTAQARVALVPRIRRWVVGHAVGHASAMEIDEHGIIAALRMAGTRALAGLPAQPDVVLLDGNHDWLSRPRQPTLFDDTPLAELAPPVVRTMIKADLRCASVAAASVLAKTERDAIMVRLAGSHPGYAWEVNKGYSTAAHTDALRRLGACVHHRQSWRLPERLDPEWDGLFAAPAAPGTGRDLDGIEPDDVGRGADDVDRGAADDDRGAADDDLDAADDDLDDVLDADRGLDADLDRHLAERLRERAAV
jgi:ribonuclease HII